MATAALRVVATHLNVSLDALERGEVRLNSTARFAASHVAAVVGQALGRKLGFSMPDEFDNVDGEIEITTRVHMQIGADYLVVNAWADEMTMKSWPARRTLPQAINDVKVALQQFPEAA